MTRNLRNRHSMAFLRFAFAGAVLMLAPSAVWAQAASNVDCDKCVDTDDIAKKAVEKKQLGKDSVTSNRIADSTIKAKDLADNAVEESKLAAGAVTGGKIADSAVTAAKLAPDAVFGRIIVVRADPLDTIGNCDALQDALADITDNDADNRYLIHLEPGIYDCGATQVLMKAYVDLQGSGRDVTRITGSVAGFIGLVSGADHAELRQLTVENRDVVGNVAVAIAANDDSFRITDVSAVARDSDTVLTIVLSGGTVVLTNVKAESIDPLTSTSQAIRVSGAAAIVELVNVTGIATDGPSPLDEGLYVATGGAGSVVTARNSVFSGGDHAVLNLAETVNLVSSQLDGGKDPSSTGTFNCVGSYDGAFAALADDCNP